MRKATAVQTILLFVGLVLMAACSPKFDFRQVHGNGFVATFPAKPSSLTRPVNLGGRQVTMTMTAVDIDGVSFAVGNAELPDATQAGQALQAMKAGLLNNIHGQLKSEKVSPASPSSSDIEAIGSPPSGTGKLLLMAHFAAKDKRIFQVLVLGPEKNISREAAETFLSSFKPD